MSLSRPDMRAVLAPLFGHRGDRSDIDRLQRVLLGPPEPTTVEEAVAAYRLAHPGASASEVYREAVRGRGLPGARKQDALRALNKGEVDPEPGSAVGGRGNRQGTRERRSS